MCGKCLFIYLFCFAFCLLIREMQWRATRNDYSERGARLESALPMRAPWLNVSVGFLLLSFIKILLRWLLNYCLYKIKKECSLYGAAYVYSRPQDTVLENSSAHMIIANVPCQSPVVPLFQTPGVGCELCLWHLLLVSPSAAEAVAFLSPTSVDNLRIQASWRYPQHQSILCCFRHL